MKVGENIYSKMFKIDIVIQQITIIIIIIPLYYERKNHFVVQMHLSRRSS